MNNKNDYSFVRLSNFWDMQNSSSLVSLSFRENSFVQVAQRSLSDAGFS